MADETYRDWDIEVVKKAGLAPRHLAMAMDVHRLTAASWLGGSASPHKMLRKKATRLMKALRLGLEDGTLPVSSKGLRTFEVDVKTIARVKRLMEEAE